MPFVPYEPGRPAPEDLTVAMTQRDGFARWLGEDMGVPSFLYGPLPGGRARTLPDIRRLAFGPGPDGLRPDAGPAQADPRHGATAVGARRVLVAYNVWVSSVEVARRVAPLVRGPEVRALGLAVGARAQVSCNLIDPDRFGPERLYDAVAALVRAAGGQGRRWRAGGAHPRSGTGHRAPRQASRARPVGGGDGGVPAPGEMVISDGSTRCSGRPIPPGPCPARRSPQSCRRRGRGAGRTAPSSQCGAR